MRRPGRSVLDPFLPYLARRLAEGSENAMALWREVQGVDCAYGPKMVQRWVAENRTRPAPRTARKWLKNVTAHPAPRTAPRTAPDVAPVPASTPAGPALPSPKQLAWLLVRPVEALSPADAAAVHWVEQDKEAALVAALAQRFTALIRRCGTTQPSRPTAPLAELDAWLAEAKACDIRAVETFAAGLEGDGAAVRAALTETWSSGQAEGQANRFKLLKRQSFVAPASTCSGGAF